MYGLIKCFKNFWFSLSILFLTLWEKKQSLWGQFVCITLYFAPVVPLDKSSDQVFMTLFLRASVSDLASQAWPEHDLSAHPHHSQSESSCVKPHKPDVSGLLTQHGSSWDKMNECETNEWPLSFKSSVRVSLWGTGVYECTATFLAAREAITAINFPVIVLLCIKWLSGYVC